MTRTEVENKLVNMTKKMMVTWAAENLNIIIKDVKNKPHNKVLDEILAKAIFEEETQEQTEEQVTQETQETREEETQEQETEEQEQETEEQTEPAPKKEKKKKEMDAGARALHEYVLTTCENIGGTIFTPAKDMKFRGLKVGAHMFVKYHWTNTSVILQVRYQALGLDAPKHPANHTFNDKYIFTEDTEETRKEIFDIMKKAYDYQLAKNLAVADKKKGKKKTQEQEN